MHTRVRRPALITGETWKAGIHSRYPFEPDSLAVRVAFALISLQIFTAEEAALLTQYERVETVFRETVPTMVSGL